jgi:CRISPR-associated exonuclease Cas4
VAGTLILLALGLLLAGAFLLWLASRQRKGAGLPEGRVIYADTGSWSKVERPLYDSELALTGRPDYLVEQDGLVIPIEVKSTNPPPAPYDSHILQLAAYCHLVTKAMAKRPPFGLLHYKGRTFEIDYTPELEEQLRSVIAEMRALEKVKSVDRSHEVSARCIHCGYRWTCEQRL